MTITRDGSLRWRRNKAGSYYAETERDQMQLYSTNGLDGSAPTSWCLRISNKIDGELLFRNTYPTKTAAQTRAARWPE